MSSDVYKPVCFKRGVMIDNIELCVFVLSDFELDSSSQGCEKAKNFLANLLTKFLINLYGMQHTVEAS